MNNDSNNYNDDLKPCPFCNGTASIWTKDKKIFWVKCDICQNSIRWGKEVEGVVKRWNNRPIEDSLKEQLEQYRKKGKNGR